MNRTSNMIRLVPMLLFAVLAVTVLHVLYAGAELSESLTVREQEGRISGTAAQYVTVRLDQAGTESVFVGEFSGIPTLHFTETIDGETYLTRVYCHDGYLRELFCAADQDMRPDDGEKLMPLDKLTFSEENGLLTIVLTEDVTVLYDLSGRRKGAAP